jgi:hypothetical protein
MIETTVLIISIGLLNVAAIMLYHEILKKYFKIERK